MPVSGQVAAGIAKPKCFITGGRLPAAVRAEMESSFHTVPLYTFIRQSETCRVNYPALK